MSTLSLKIGRIQNVITSPCKHGNLGRASPKKTPLNKPPRCTKKSLHLEEESTSEVSNGKCRIISEPGFTVTAHHECHHLEYPRPGATPDIPSFACYGAKIQLMSKFTPSVIFSSMLPQMMAEIKAGVLQDSMEILTHLRDMTH
ncbi:hypothetical protein TorRG33x02_032550, partial [Trema orientale]